MTDKDSFKQAYAAFRAATYPDYPQWTMLQDWNSELLTIDGHVAGYASRVYADRMRARDVPNLDKLVRDVKSLRGSLESIQPATEQDARLVNDYRAYISALELVVTELSRLALEES